MTDTCEQIRSHLVELLYDEVDPETERRVRLHLEACPACRERMEAYQHVRTDLDEWETAGVPPRISFVGLPPWRRRSTASAWTRRLAVAASFVLGILVTGALINLQVERTPDGWTARTGLWPSAAVSSSESPAADVSRRDGRPGAAGTDALPAGTTSSPSGQVRFISSARGDLLPEADLDRLLESGAAPSPGAAPTGARLTPAQRAEIRGLLRQTLAEREARFREDLRNMVTASEARQQEEYGAALASVYDLLQVQHEQDLMALTGQLGLVEADTGDQLQQTHAAIDYLLRQVSARNDLDDSPERR